MKTTFHSLQVSHVKMSQKKGLGPAPTVEQIQSDILTQVSVWSTKVCSEKSRLIIVHLMNVYQSFIELFDIRTIGKSVALFLKNYYFCVTTCTQISLLHFVS